MGLGQGQRKEHGWRRQARRTGAEDEMSGQIRSGQDADAAGPQARAGRRPGPYGRRALLFGAAAAGAGAAVSLAGGAAPAAAAADNNGGPVLLGETNTATATTTITNASGGGIAGNTSANGGHSGVHGNDTSTEGGSGVAGNSANGIGVNGVTSATDGAGVQGTTYGEGNGVAGIDSSGSDLSCGVSGTSTIGYGVSGSCPNGVAIYGESTNGYAVQASAPSGTAGLLVQGTSIFQGMTQFSNCGVATVAKSDKSVTVTLAGVTVDSIVLATLQELQAGIAVAAAVPGTGSFTITLTSDVPAAANVGWFVIGTASS
jgi:hypothetical protein